MGRMQIVSTAGVKKSVEMTEKELENAVSDIREVIEYLTRGDASYEEKCFAEEVKTTANVYTAELTRRRSSKLGL